MSRGSSLVLALGNRLAGADGFGPAVLDELRSGGVPVAAVLVDAHTDLLAHLDDLARSDRVVLVDAVLSSSGGGVSCLSEEQFSTWDERSSGAHAMSPLLAVKLFRSLSARGLLPAGDPRITLVAYFVDEAAFGRAPDPSTIRAGADAVRAALAERIR